MEIFRSLLRLAGERRQQRVTLEKLRAQVAETRLRCREAEQAQSGWNGIRKFAVAKKVAECDDVHAFYLKPHDGRPLPAFKPGQYLTFQLDLPGRDKPLDPLLLAFRQPAQGLLPRHHQEGKSAAGQTGRAAGRGFELFQ